MGIYPIRPGRSDFDTLRRITDVVAIGLALPLAAILTGNWPSPLPVAALSAMLLAWFAGAWLLMVLLRAGLRAAQRLLRARNLNTRGVVIVGVNELGLRLAADIDATAETGLRVVGFYDDRPAARTPPIPSGLGQRIGDLDELVARARRGQVDLVFIALPMRAERRIQRVLERLSDSTASVYLVPDFFVFQMLHSRWTTIRGLPVVSLFESPLYGIDGLLKRAMDLIVASGLLVLLAVPLLLVGLCIKLTSPGPALFRQRRYGLDGREILVWKFRTMRVCEDGASVAQARRDDQRVTRIGRLLRKASIDEIPQLLNVLDGSMSLVGPRPHPSVMNEQYRRQILGYMLRHKVKPGITGLAQIRGWRGETNTLDKMARRIECDHQYIREWSLWLDCKILLCTVWVFWRQDAY
ncbi:MAG: undecaprenyl-phosphate glucose phosphotransferase [Pirellulaceae bacterium]|nr:undecaprenyl-phosphate glucose phosphotransferase [Pirellulaceae bacterium]